MEAIFRAKGDNLIQTVMGPNGPTNQNTGQFTNTGIEFSGNYQLSDQLVFNTNYSFISMKVPVIASPEQQLYVSGTYKWSKLTFNLSVQHIQNLYTQIVPTKEISSYSLINSRVSLIMNKNVDLFLKGENLTDKKYYINYKYPMPGIIFFAGINLHF